MFNRNLATALFLLLGAGCGGSDEKASKGDPDKSNQKTAPSKSARLTRDQALVDEYVRLVKNTTEKLNQISDKETALSAAKQLGEHARRVRQIAEEIKAAGQLTVEENDQISAQPVLEIREPHAEACRKVSKFLASNSLPPEVLKAVADALQEWGEAITALSEAMRGIGPAEQPGGR
jgi:hypothetical protein